ncbi:MAG: DUF971 domain-containing protein [Planctomycetota bacterium]
MLSSPPRAINAIRAERVVEITWADEHVARYPMRLLRTSCRCAGCVNELTGEPILDPASVPEDVGITALQAVGNYAVKFTFTDGHDTGISTWSHLKEICPCPACKPVT